MDSEDPDLIRYIVDVLGSDLIRLYIGTDLIGTEIGAAAKNVIGLAAGMLDGFGYESLKGPLMARGAREVARLISAMGGNRAVGLRAVPPGRLRGHPLFQILQQPRLWRALCQGRAL